MNVSNLTHRQSPLPVQPATPAEIRPAVSGQRQDTAAAGSAQGAGGSPTQHQPEQQVQTSAESFVQKMFEQMLANRLGIDKEKLDEIREKIEQIEKEKQVLQEQAPLDSKQKQHLQTLDDKLAALEQAMQDLLKEADERRSRDEARPDRIKEQLARYRQFGAG